MIFDGTRAETGHVRATKHVVRVRGLSDQTLELEDQDLFTFDSMPSLLSKLLSSHQALFLVLCLGPTPFQVQAQADEKLAMDARDAIVRGLAYFSGPELALSSDAALFHAYLKERYALPELCSSQAVITRLKEDRANEPLYMFLRMAEPIPFEIDFVAPEGWLNAVTASGMWYDKLPDKRILVDRIEALDLNDPCCVTHALWAMAMARHCFQAELDTTLEQKLVTMNKEIMERDRPHWGDVAIEALVFAQYHDPSYIPPAAYIEEIISLQNADGSWNIVAGDPNSHSQHTTMLALWALLEYEPLAWPTYSRDIMVH